MSNTILTTPLSTVDIPDNLLASIYAYLQPSEIAASLVSLNKGTRKLLTKLSGTNQFWKDMVETLIGWRLPSSIIKDWKEVYYKLSDVEEFVDDAQSKTDYFINACDNGYTERACEQLGW